MTVSLPEHVRVKLYGIFHWVDVVSVKVVSYNLLPVVVFDHEGFLNVRKENVVDI